MPPPLIITYTGSGTVFIDGCGEYTVARNYDYLWNVGDTCFLRYKAIKGKLEKIVIKQIKLVTNYQINGEIKFIYVDTLNALYNESDLITQYQAVNLAKQYYEFQMFLALSARTTCQLRPQGSSSYSGQNPLPGGFS